MKPMKGFTMTRLGAALAAGGLICGLCLLAVLPAQAGSGNDRAIRDLRTLRTVDRVVVVDVSSTSRWIWAKRAHNSVMPLTPLQSAIVRNRPLIDAINRTVWSFDLKSVYAARVEGYTVYLYEGEPPPM
jgi:hypothetical protein